MNIKKSIDQTAYDFIIGGAGLAGLSLAYRMLKAGLLNKKSLLLIDIDLKEQNDRTWSFWAKDIHKITDCPPDESWSQANLKSDDLDLKVALAPYTYHSINGLSYYTFIKERLKEAKTIDWLQASILDYRSEERTVQTSAGKLNYRSVFFPSHFSNHDIASFNRAEAPSFMWQHFLGWQIQTEDENFTEESFTYMDMGIKQVENGLSFFYILPYSKNKALIEYTLFSAGLLEKESYKKAVKHYIEEVLKIQNYQIVEEEYNKIPMTTAIQYPRPKDASICPIGTLSGSVKASTGYSFLRVQKQTQHIVNQLQNGNTDNLSYSFSKRHKLYDAILLEVMANGTLSGQEVFESLYKNNPFQLLLKFLDEETSLWEEFKIINSVPKGPFLAATAKVMKRIILQR